MDWTVLIRVTDRSAIFFRSHDHSLKLVWGVNHPMTNATVSYYKRLQ